MKTDSEIQKNVTEELFWEPILRQSEIGTSVNDGVVTLSGHVDSYSKRMAAERAVKRVVGVRAIAMDLDVNTHSTLKKTDTEIAHQVIDALKWNSALHEAKLKVKVDDAWVTLEGEVEWEFQRAYAKVSLENLIGVRGITNLIKIKPGVSMGNIKQKINAAFQRHAFIDAGKINIETVGNKVILSGKVRSLVESHDAEVAAWSAPGVTQVENKLEVRLDEALLANL